MFLPCNNSEINVKDIYAIIQIRTDLFADTEMQKRTGLTVLLKGLYFCSVMVVCVIRILSLSGLL